MNGFTRFIQRRKKPKKRAKRKLMGTQIGPLALALMTIHRRSRFLTIGNGGGKTKTGKFEGGVSKPFNRLGEGEGLTGRKDAGKKLRGEFWSVRGKKNLG